MVTSLSFSIETAANPIDCERIGNFRHKFSPYSSRHVVFKTCFMDESTVINLTDFTISEFQDETIARLDFFGNKQIFYLPVNVSQSFPKLLFYNAQNCSIKNISRENFEALFESKKLYLDNNEIDRIQKDTFEVLQMLEWLTLSMFEVE